MNERIKQLRKILNLTLEEFGKRVGVTKTAISRLENGSRGITDQMSVSICREFGVREEWLLNGTGEIFQEEQTFSLDRFVQDHGGTELELKIIKTYFELDPAIRRAVLDHFRTAFGQPAEQQKNSPSTEQLEEEYKKSVLDGASTTTQSVWNTTSDTAACD